ncbi:MAG: Rpn family recombination-promoting nuclease/putative transposase [Eubacterium sp.]|nr:Rpn family recombination-promoting nuclease/putative transposase [Eubacterium sp.]
MANKDLPEKLLEDYNDIFTDIVNVLLFNGERIIKDNELENMLPVSQYKAETGVLHEEERDTGKKWKHGNIILSSIGFENQNKYFKNMPVRIIGYDGANYREQLLDKKAKRIYPVISIVLNFSEHRWTKNLNLLSCLDVPEILKPYVNDYKIFVYNIAFLTDEQIDMFTSDFKIVARYFKDRRENKVFRFPDKKPEHVDEIIKLLTAITGDKRIGEIWRVVEKKEGENMSEKWIDTIEARGEARGIAQGEVRGKILAYYEMGLSINEIAQKIDVTISYVRQVLGLQPVSE